MEYKLEHLTPRQALENCYLWVLTQRLLNPEQANHLVFSFPQVKLQGSDEWTGSAVTITVAAIRASEGDGRLSHTKYPETSDSIFVRLNSVTDVEYKVSRQGMDKLLSIGCCVVREGKKKGVFYVRIRLDSPLVTGKPFKFEDEALWLMAKSIVDQI